MTTVWLLIGFAAGTGALFAQVELAKVVGRVGDPSGAVVSGAEIQMRRVATNEKFRALTSSTGDYTLLNLPSGAYEMTASMAGFKTEVRSGLILEIGSTSRFDFVLSLGQVSDVIRVTSQVPLLRTESAEMGHVVNNQTMLGLPINSRDVVSLARMIPGVMPSRDTLGDGSNNFTTINVQGRRRSDNVVWTKPLRGIWRPPNL